MRPIKEVGLSHVLLDLENYRIPDSQASQDDALHYLFESENVLELVEKIAHDGYLDNELPLVVRAETEGGETGEFIVLEGNRRVAALKALSGLVTPDGCKKQLNKVRKKYAHELKNLPTKIRVMVMESRESALPHLGRMHIGESKRRWSRDQQATFYYSMLDKNTNVSDLRVRFPNQPGLNRLLKMASVRRFISHAKFTDGSLRAYAASADLTMSSFEYAYRSKDIADAVGISFNDDGLIEPSPEREGAELDGQKLGALELLLTKFRSNELNTRSAALKKGTPEYVELIRELEGKSETADGQTPRPDEGSTEKKEEQQSSYPGGANTPSNEETRGDDQQGNNSEESSPRSRHDPRTYQHLNMKSVENLYRDDKVRNNIQILFVELQKINVSDLPVASTMLMRAVLEATVKRTLTDQEQHNRNQLKQLFKVVQDKANSENWPCKGGVNIIADANVSTPGSITWFNMVAHDFDLHPAGETLHHAWSLVYPVIEHMLKTSLDGTP